MKESALSLCYCVTVHIVIANMHPVGGPSWSQNIYAWRQLTVAAGIRCNPQIFCEIVTAQGSDFDQAIIASLWE